MTRLRCFCLCACLTLSLTAMACGSSNSGTALPTGWDQARVAFTGVSWWVNTIKSAYYFEVKLTPSSQDDAPGRATVITFTQKVVGGLTSGTPAAASLVPSAPTAPDPDPTHWTLDQNNAKTANGVAVATDFASATYLIDGAADPFYDSTKSYQAKALAWEVYTNGTYSIDLKVWQMASAKDGSQIYADLLADPLYSPDNVPWITCKGTDTSNPCPAP